MPLKKELESAEAERCQWTLASAKVSPSPCQDQASLHSSWRHRRGKVSKRADGGGWQKDKQEMALVSLLLQTGCGRVNCWHGMPGELEGLAVAQEVVVAEKQDEEGNRERETGTDSVSLENAHVEREGIQVCFISSSLICVILRISKKHPWVCFVFCFLCSFTNTDHLLTAWA